MIVLDEAESFNQEFKNRAQRNLGNVFGRNDAQRNYAIENGSDRPRSSKSRHGDTVRSSTSFSDRSSGSGGDHAPIVTIPDDEDERYDAPRGNR